MEFRIDKDLRRRCSSKIVGATLGGKIALTLCSICTVLFFLSTWLMVAYGTESLNSGDEAAFIKFFYSAFAFSVFFMAGPIGFIITYRQRNVGVAIRTHERLLLEDGWLRYSFHPSGDRDVNSLSVFAINLRECNLQLGPNGECVFTGGVVSWRYEDVLNNRLRSLDEMNPVSSFEIWPYWSPDLYETLVAEQRRLASFR